MKAIRESQDIVNLIIQEEHKEIREALRLREQKLDIQKLEVK